MDITWDDSGTYEYFCVPDSQMFADHTLRNTFPVPKATATKYSYSEVMGITTYTDVNSAYNGLVEQAAKNYKNGVYETDHLCKAGNYEQPDGKGEPTAVLCRPPRKGLRQQRLEIKQHQQVPHDNADLTFRRSAVPLQQ